MNNDNLAEIELEISEILNSLPEERAYQLTDEAKGEFERFHENLYKRSKKSLETTLYSNKWAITA